jgi:hypothetical protein
MWYVIGLIWVALMAGIVYAYNRKQRQRNVERAEKMAALLRDLKSNPIVEPVNVAGERPATAAAGPEFRRKPRLLPQSTALLYYVFRTGLPDHEIFAGHTLADVLDIAPALAGALREEMRRKLAQQRLDLVVCTKQLEVVAVVVTGNAASDSHADDKSFIAQCLQAAGIRIVSVDPAAPPRHHEVRALVYS